MSELESFEASFDTDRKVYKVFAVLRDQQWHCRGCEYAHVGTTQIAGGAGIQGLQRGTRSRPGMIIDSGDHYCAECADKKDPSGCVGCGWYDFAEWRDHLNRYLQEGSDE